MNKKLRIILTSMHWYSKGDLSYFAIMETIDDVPVKFYWARRPLKAITHAEKYRYYSEIFN